MPDSFHRDFVISNINSSLPFDLLPEIKNGSVLAGDDLTGGQLSTWFAQEQEAFYKANDGNSETDPWYAYMRTVNEILGFSKVALSRGSPRSILILGPGSGIEIDRFASKNPEWDLWFLEASNNFKVELKNKFPQSHIVDATASGDISLNERSQDVVCAFSVLHHIPNVSHVIQEVYRVMKPGSLFLVREPCSSMGDWRFPRSATPNERGISRTLLTATAQRAGFKMESKPVPVLFAPLNGLLKKIGTASLMPSRPFYWLDRLVSWGASLNDYYWRDAWYKKVGPSAYFYVFRKPGVEQIVPLPVLCISVAGSLLCAAD